MFPQAAVSTNPDQSQQQSFIFANATPGVTPGVMAAMTKICELEEYEVPRKKRSSRELQTALPVTCAADMFSLKNPLPTKLNNLKLEKKEGVTIPPPQYMAAPAPTASSPAGQFRPRENSQAAYHELLSSGLLAATDQPPIQFPRNWLPDDSDVILNERDNVAFQRLIGASVQAFACAIRLRSPSGVKNLVKAVVQSVTQSGGHFLCVSTDNMFVEVSRNMAERYTLQELRSAKKQMQVQVSSILPAISNMSAAAAATSSSSSVSSAPGNNIPVALNNLRPSMMKPTTKSVMARRVSPPEVKVPSAEELEDFQDIEEMEGCCEHKMYGPLARSGKQQPNPIQDDSSADSGQQYGMMQKSSSKRSEISVAKSVSTIEELEDSDPLSLLCNAAAMVKLVPGGARNTESGDSAHAFTKRRRVNQEC